MNRKVLIGLGIGAGVSVASVGIYIFIHRKEIKMNGKIIAGIGAVFGLAGLAFGAYSAYKTQQMSNRLNGVLDDLSDNMDVDIQDAVVEEAVDRAVSREVKVAAKEAVDRVKSTFDDDIRIVVTNAVEAEKAAMKPRIEEQITKRIGYIDISAAKEEVISRAKTEAAEKFKGDLDAILTNHNEELKNIQTIYSSIASSMKGAAV